MAAISRCYTGARIIPVKRSYKVVIVVLRVAALGSTRILGRNNCYTVASKSITSTGLRVAKESCYKQLVLGSQNRPG